jgi:hypothetical protein
MQRRHINILINTENNPRHMRAVTVVIIHSAGIIDEVPTVNVIHIAIAFVIDSVGRNFTRIGPHGAGPHHHVVSGVEACINYGDDRSGTTGRSG